MRMLLAMVLVAGVLSSQGGGGTLAFFTSSATSGGQQFTAGTLVVDTSTLPAASFGWTTSRGGTNCSTATGFDVGTLIGTQRFLPGHFCNAAITLINSGNLDMWARLRLVRTTATGTAVNEALNNKLMFFMSEYTTGGTTTAAARQAAECGAGNLVYGPSAVSSAGTITNVAVDAPTNTAGRTAISRITASGKVVGGTNATTNAGLGTLGLSAQTTGGAAPSPANEGMMVANSFFNIIGTDAVDATSLDGTTTPEASFPAGTTRYYCAAIFFPSDTSQSSANGTGDNAAQGGDMTYYLYLTGAQKSGR